jgi:nicotinate phosphoribosyltransferase
LSRKAVGTVRGPLFTDFYELAMAQAYFRADLADRPSQFEYFFRSPPDYGSHQAGFCVTVGLSAFLDHLERMEFTRATVEPLAHLLDHDFLEWLCTTDQRSGLEVAAIQEGRVVHPHEPIITVTGPLAIAQLVETSLLNHLNYPTLVATKAARIVQSANGAPVLEFGMRRGPGIGVNEGVRAALIAGCAASSHVEASLDVGVDPRGTHAHSLVQAYMALGRGELEAFRLVAETTPENCVLLVDTIDTLRSGVPNAITVFDELRAAGHGPGGIRLDSGDLAWLAVQSAGMLDAAGHADASIVLSGDLDEIYIWQIRTQIAEEAAREGLDAETITSRLVHGVGTRLITSHGDAALNGVYKMVGIQDEQGSWRPAIKISETPEKISTPGRKDLWRLQDPRGRAVADLMTIEGEELDLNGAMQIHHPVRAGVATQIRAGEIARAEPLQRTVFDGQRLAGKEPLDVLRQRCADDIRALDAGVRRLVNPHRYHVSVSDALHRRREAMIASDRPGPPGGTA